MVLECSKCGESKTEDAFIPSRGTGQVFRKRRCVECVKATAQRWYAENPDRWKETRDPAKHRANSKKHWEKRGLYLKYGITQDELDAQVAVQNGVCAVCGQEPDKLHIDHNHDTGKVRGLLCGNCNRALGLMYDDVESLEHAIAYLKAGGSWQS